MEIMFLGMTKQEARRALEVKIGEVRMARRSERVELVVGKHVVKDTIEGELRSYGFNWCDRYDNEGVIVTTIE